MAISWVCECGKWLRAQADLAGKRTRCPDCGVIVRVPNPGPPATTAAPTARPTPSPAPDGADTGEVDPYDLAPVTPAPAPPRPPADRTTWGDPGGYQVATTFRPSRGSATPQGRAPAEATAAPRQSRRSSATLRGEVTLREYTYLLLALALIPLVISLLARGPSDLQARFLRSVAQATPEHRAQIQAGWEAADSKGLITEATYALLPQGRILGAHLSRDSQAHWVWAVVAATGFLLLLTLMFSVERAEPWHLAVVSGFTGTVGVALLLAVQFCSHLHFVIRRRWGGFGGFRGIWAVLAVILMAIGWSYNLALDPRSNFVVSALGFTCGVGLCEELVKVVPLIYALHRSIPLGWRSACLWGLASGIGFGVAEGVLYAARDYNGVSGVEVYLVRFVSCVALHAIWSGSVAIGMARHADTYDEADDMTGVALFLIQQMAVPMLLHGFYDTFLKKEMNLAALGTAALSFLWFAGQVEWARRAHPDAGRRPTPTFDPTAKYAPVTPVG